MSFADDEKNQTLIEHLTELRIRIIRAIYFIAGGTILSYSVSEKIFNIIREPVRKFLPDGGLYFTHPVDKFMAHLKLSVVAGIILSCPFWLNQIWKFVAPGLYQKEKKYALSFIFTGTFLFLFGVLFAYYLALPMAFEYLFNFGGTVDKPMITIDQYLSFITQIFLMFGVAFELPLIIVILGMLGIVNATFLRTNRRYAIMTIAIMAAIFSPPDLMSMIFMLVPMQLLFEISILVLSALEKNKLKENIE